MERNKQKISKQATEKSNNMMQEQGQQDDEEEDRTTTAAATPPSKSRRNLILVSVLSVALLAWAIVVTVMYSNVSAQVRRGVGKSSTTSSQSQLRVSSMGNNGTATAGNDDDDDDTTSAQQPQQQQCLRTDVRPLPTEPTIKLSTAQNALNYEYFAEHYFNKVLPPLGPLETVAYMVPAYGSKELLALVAEMLSKAFKGDVDPSDLYGTAGTTATLDTLMRILQNPDGQRNDAIVSSPFWPGFRWATEALKVNGTLRLFDPADQATMQVTAEDVEAALEANPGARFLYLCNPNNPLGVIYDKQNLEDIYSYVLNSHPDVHIISDEMYAHSILPEHREKYVSMLALDAYKQATDEQRQRLHLVWGFAKDFGFNGWKVGFVYTENRLVRDAFDPPADSGSDSIAFISTPISALTDYYLVNFLRANSAADDGEKLWSAGMERYPVELQRSYDTTKQFLDGAGIKYFPHNYAAQFFWLNLTAEADALGGERNLTALLANNGLALGPGRNYGGPADGYYRLCYTCYTRDVLERGLNILVDTVTAVNAQGGGRVRRSLRSLMDFDVDLALRKAYDPRDPL